MGKNQEKIKEALDRIEAGLATINSDENWLSYLCFQSKFYNYSFGNTMLIYSQNPQANYVKGYKACGIGRSLVYSTGRGGTGQLCSQKVQIIQRSDAYSKKDMVLHFAEPECSPFYV